MRMRISRALIRLGSVPRRRRRHDLRSALVASPDPSERERIMEAASRLLSAGHSLAVTDVLEGAGLSTRAFYRHFESEDALLLALFRRDSERVNTQLEAAVDAAATPRDALIGWIRGPSGWSGTRAGGSACRRSVPRRSPGRVAAAA